MTIYSREGICVAMPVRPSVLPLNISILVQLYRASACEPTLGLKSSSGTWSISTRKKAVRHTLIPFGALNMDTELGACFYVEAIREFNEMYVICTIQQGHRTVGWTQNSSIRPGPCRAAGQSQKQ